MSDVNRRIPSGLDCFDCGEPTDSAVRNGWATLVHHDGRTDHPVRTVSDRSRYVDTRPLGLAVGDDARDVLVDNLLPWCLNLRGGDRDGYMCCRNVHTGQHVARVNGRVVAVWDNAR
jgi:hypothetical protein